MIISDLVYKKYCIVVVKIDFLIGLLWCIKHVGFSCQNWIKILKDIVCFDVVPDKMGYFDEVKYKCSSTSKAYWKLFVLKTY